MIINNTIDLIGNTPLFQLKSKSNEWDIYLKMEKYNPGGSMKDRMALNMIESAERKGKIHPGGTIIESSSGNTAIGLMLAAIAKGYKFIAVVDHHASKDKLKLIKAYGGELVFVGDGYKANEVAVVEREKKAFMLAQSIENAFYPNQADNFDNRSAYINTLAVELIDDINNIDRLYGAIGTGGSLCGTAMGLKQRGQHTKIIAIEPDGSIIFGGTGKPYFQSGTGNPVNAPIPQIIDYTLIDLNLYATDTEAFNTCRFFAQKYGILVGGSAGGVIYKALEDIQKEHGKGTAVILLCDGGERYLDTIYNNEWMKKNDLLDESIGKKISNWIERT